MTDDDDREATVSDDEARDDEVRDDEWFGRGEGSGDDGGPTTVDDRDRDASERSSREPLGDLRERVVDGDEARTPGRAFPEDASAAADGRDGHDEGDAMGSDSGSDSGPEGDSGSGSDSADPTVPEAGRDGPLGELAADIDGRRERQTKADDALFDEVEVGEVDADELWSQVESDGPTVEPRDEREIREVRKRKYCSQCPYFAEPPEVGCSHEGTDILQQVDMEHFEVADCPVVLEDERLEDVTTE